MEDKEFKADYEGLSEALKVCEDNYKKAIEEVEANGGSEEEKKRLRNAYTGKYNNCMKTVKGILTYEYELDDEVVKFVLIKVEKEGKHENK